MHRTAGKGPSPFFGIARFNWRCWPSGLAYSMPVSKVTPSGMTAAFCAKADPASSHAARKRLAASERAQSKGIEQGSESEGEGIAAEACFPLKANTLLVSVGVPGRDVRSPSGRGL